MKPWFAPLNPRLDAWSGRTVWIVGASSGIGLALAEQLSRAGARVVVSARRADALHAWVHTGSGRFACPLDVTDAPAVQAAVTDVCATHGVPDLVVYAAGIYRPQQADAWDVDESRAHCAVNYLGAVTLAALLVPRMCAEGRGHLSFISSVAGYRGLPQALAYGPTKAALHNLAEILYHDLHGQGLGISLVNPGFVNTRLTRQNGFAMPALLSADEAARQIVLGWAAGRFEIHFPRRFTLWLKLGRLLPYRPYFALLRRITT